MAKSKKMLIGVLDAETDPFKYMRVPKPFALEFYSLEGDQCHVTWGDDCVPKMVDYLEQLKQPYLIFAHNGGKFDFHFFFQYIDNPIKVIKARIVSAKLFHHTFRDSFAFLPIPLRDYEKDEFDYSLMERPVRERNKEVILRYLHSDCVHLYDLVADFIERFGRKLTIGGTAMGELRKRHTFEAMTERHDEVYRPYYYGGRVQCWEDGILEGPWECVDVNSSYPKSMRDFQHPRNGRFELRSSMPDNFDRPFFLHFHGRSNGALPSFGEGGKLLFSNQEGDFYACSHEIQAALELGSLTIDKVHSCKVASETISFAQYVDDFFRLKTESEAIGDKAGRLFAKLLLNSAYGKFGQSPYNFRDWYICRDPGEIPFLEEAGYEWVAEFPEFDMFARPSLVNDRGFYDVSVAASITSASRSILLRGLAASERPIYCDTDSIICRSFHGELDDKKLGAWKLEKRARYCAIAGKKVYALYNDPRGPDDSRAKKPTNVMKIASKGGTLSLRDVLDVCEGKTVRWDNDAPTFSIRAPLINLATGKIRKGGFIHREFRMTVDREADEVLETVPF